MVLKNLGCNVCRSQATFALRDWAAAKLKQEQNIDPAVTKEAFTRLCRKSISDLALDDSVRVDGRSVEDIREISCEVDLHKPLHGSALFQRQAYF